MIMGKKNDDVVGSGVETRKSKCLITGWIRETNKKAKTILDSIEPMDFRSLSTLAKIKADEVAKDITDELKDTDDFRYREACRRYEYFFSLSKQLRKVYDLKNDAMRLKLRPVSYTHLTLPTKRIV